MTTNYTDELTREIVAEYEANPCKETITRISQRIDKSERSVIGKLSSEGVYRKPERLTKTGEPVVKKEELVEGISTMLGIDVPTLVKAGREDLKKLHAAVEKMNDL